MHSRLYAYFFTALILVASPAFASRSYYNIDQRSGWSACSGCAGAGGAATYSMKQGVNSPSIDGASVQFNLGGTKPFSHALFWNRLGSAISTETHFTLDLKYYLKNPAASQGLEIAANQAFGGKRYKWSMQCSFGSGVWRTWDNAGKRWVNTGIACKRPAAYKWQHFYFEYQRVNGRSLYVSLTIDGVKHYINKSFGPESYSENGMSVRYQINGNSTETDYSAWVDKMTFKAW
jgi:hypothetical protein